MGYDELLAVGDMDKFLTKAKEMCEVKIHATDFVGMEKEDVVQEVLLSVYRAVDAYDSSRAKASTFFENVINNRIRDCLRKAKTNMPLCLAVELVESPEDISNDSGSTHKSNAVLKSVDGDYGCSEYEIDFMENIGLNDREKQIFKLRCAGYEFTEIATMLGLTKARISQLWKGVIKKYEDA
jgi:RNA polymerase sporulation-specific sigma factor